MKFKDYLLEEEIYEAQSIDAVTTMLFLQENELHFDLMSEGAINESLNDWLSKIGLHAHKGKGIINYISQFGSLAGKMILAAIKGDAKKVKELSKQVTKEEILDFLYKLDQATLHIVTGPAHMIDSILGWHISANIDHLKKGTQDVLSKIWQAIMTIKDHVAKVLSPDHQKTVLVNLQNLEKSIPQP